MQKSRGEMVGRGRRGMGRGRGGKGRGEEGKGGKEKKQKGRGQAPKYFGLEPSLPLPRLFGCESSRKPMEGGIRVVGGQRHSSPTC